MAKGSKEELVDQLAAHRAHLSDHLAVVKTGINPGYQIKSSLRNHPGKWAAVGVGTGFFVTRLFRRKKIVYKNGPKKRGLVTGTALFLFKLAKPALAGVALKQIQDLAESKFGYPPPQDNSMLGGPPQK